MNNAVFAKAKENVKKHRDIELVATKKNKNLFGVRTKLSYYKVFHGKVISNRNEKNRDTYELTCLSLGLSILELSKILTYKFKWNYVKPKYDEKVKLCYMDKDSYII